MFKRILVAVDGSAPSMLGLEAAVALASDQRAELVLLHIVDDASYLRAQGHAGMADYAQAYVKALNASGRSILQDAQAVARARGVEGKVRLGVTGGHSIAHAIVDQARRLRADIIVVGTHGRRGVRHMLLGSDAEAVLRQSHIPVLVVPERPPVKRVAKSARAAVAAPQEPARKRKGRRILPSTLIESSQ